MSKFIRNFGFYFGMLAIVVLLFISTSAKLDQFNDARCGVCGEHVTQTPPFSIADQVEQIRPSVVHISKTGVCQGSGCLVSSDGIIFTAKHVSDDTHGDYVVTLDDGRTFTTKYVVEDKENDVTFMQLDLDGAEPNLPYAILAQEDTLRVGDGVIIGGSPLGKDNFNTFSLGILSAEARELYDRSGWESYKEYTWHVMLQTTSPAFPGNSGGPIFNMTGEVIGVLVAGQAETLNFGVPVARFRDTIDTVRQWFALCRFNVVEEEVAVTPADEWYSQENGHGYPCH